VFTVYGRSWPEAVTEEVELRIRMLASASPVLAANDLGFVRMHFQLAFRQTCRKLCLYGYGFGFRPTVYQSIICITAPWEVRVLSRHPRIERVVHEQIC
jgi:hypothetical protein